jgi:hypothetical protein
MSIERLDLEVAKGLWEKAKARLWAAEGLLKKDRG